jgi:hypothetical protein
MLLPDWGTIRPLPRGTSVVPANPIRQGSDGSARTKHERGQSVVEFALVLPLMIFLMLAIIDFSRIYTTPLTVESAAREAADFGTFGSQKWNDAVYSLPVDGTEAKMRLRACTAMSELPDYVGPDDSCSNPTLTYELSGDKGATWGPYSTALACDDAAREPPCWLKVTLSYDFHIITPVNIQFLDKSLGLPSTLTLVRSSTFAMTDLSLP